MSNTRKPKRRRPPKSAPEVERALAPDATPEPYPGRIRIVYLPPSSTGGERVTEDTALTYAAVWACVKVITEALASLPWRVMRKRPGGGADHADTNLIDWLTHRQPNPETSAFTFRETLIAHALTWGNGYAEIERDAASRPAWLWQLTPDRVTPMRDPAGNLVYQVSNYGEPETYLPASDMLHLKGLGFDGLVGYDVIRYAARTIGTGLAMDDYSSSLFANDSTPGGVLKHPNVLSDQARNNLRDTWERLHKGPANRRRLAILEEGMEWMQTSLPPEANQLIQNKTFTVLDICRIFGVPPHKIFELSRATFSNIEQQEIAFVADTLMPWARRLEQEADLKLFGRQSQGTYYTKFNFNARLRGDSAARAAFYESMNRMGAFSANDVLEAEDRNPIGAEGDKHLVQLNLTTLEKVGEDPPEAPAPARESPGEAPKGGGNAREQMALVMALQPVLEDACRRVLRRGEHRARDAVTRLAQDPAAFASWLARFEPEHRAYLAEALRPIVQALASLAGGSEVSAETALAVYAERHWGEFRELLAKALQPDVRVDFSVGWVTDAIQLRECVLAAAAATRAAGVPAWFFLEADQDDGGNAADVIADILGALMSEEALEKFLGEYFPEELGFNPNQKRGPDGKWIAGGAMAKSQAGEAIAGLKEKKGAVTPKEAKDLLDKLGKLTVKQLHELKAEHGLKASAGRKAELVKKLADRLKTQAQGGGTPDGPLLPGKPINERLKAYKEGDAAVRRLADAHEAGREARDDYKRWSAHREKTAVAYSEALEGKDKAKAKAAKTAYHQAQKRTDEALQGVEKADQHEATVAASVLAAKDLAVFRVDNQLQTGIQIRQTADDAVNWVHRNLQRNSGDPPILQEIVLEHTATPIDRAHFMGGSSTSRVRLNPHNDTGTGVHELGHAIENHVPGARKAAQDYLIHRVGQEPAVKLHEQFPQAGFDAWETGRRDDFDRHFQGSSAYYCGKYYSDGNTEIISMGVEAMYRNPGKFAKDDPEYAKFIIGILKGHLR